MFCGSTPHIYAGIDSAVKGAEFYRYWHHRLYRISGFTVTPREARTPQLNHEAPKQLERVPLARLFLADASY